MGIDFDQLVLEVTRKCNMVCEHCLRGDAQNLDMSKEIVNRLLGKTKSITSLLITGGEPVLNDELIEYIVDELLQRKIPVDNFYVATNGVIVSKRTAKALLRLHGITTNYEENNGFEVSIDDYHEKLSHNSFGVYKKLPFFGLRENIYKERGLLNMGKAHDNGIGNREISDEVLDVSCYGDSTYVQGLVYVNAKGDVLCGGDYSYSEQENRMIGNVANDMVLELEAYYTKIMREIA